MAIDLVSAPHVLSINLTRAADFIRILEVISPEVFPTGSTVSLVFRASNGTTLATWAATVVSTDATWNVDKVAVDALIIQTPATCRLIYTDGAVDILWGLATTVGIDG